MNSTNLTAFVQTLDNIILKKKHIPGVGNYQTLETDKKLSAPITSLKMRRH